MTQQTTPELSFEGRVATITLRRPELANRLGHEDLKEGGAAWAATDLDVRTATPGSITTGIQPKFTYSGIQKPNTGISNPDIVGPQNRLYLP